MTVLTLTAEYESAPYDDDSEVHGHVVLSIGSFEVARIPCRYNYGHFQDGGREEIEQAVALFLKKNMPDTELDL